MRWGHRTWIFEFERLKAGCNSEPYLTEVKYPISVATLDAQPLQVSSRPDVVDNLAPLEVTQTISPETDGTVLYKQSAPFTIWGMETSSDLANWEVVIGSSMTSFDGTRYFRLHEITRRQVIVPVTQRVSLW